MPNFKDVSTLAEIKPYTKANPGEVLISHGTFIGVTENQYGELYNFEESEGFKKIALPGCGKLKNLLETGSLKLGYKYRVVFLGKQVLTKGAYSGKTFNDLEVLEDADFTPDKTVSYKVENATPQNNNDDILA